VSYFAFWADKENDIGQTSDRVASLLYDNNISESGLTHTPTGVSEDVALINKKMFPKHLYNKYNHLLYIIELQQRSPQIERLV